MNLGSIARLTFGVLVLAGATARPAQESGWVSLFDGQSLSGWTAVPLPGNENSTKWEVKDGAIVGSGNASMLYSPKGDYKNFRFRAEIKINDKGNSGLYFRAAKAPSFTSGYESQINATHADPIKTGSIYTNVHLFKAAHKPDEWYTQEIEVVDRDFRGKTITSITVKVNGEVLFQFQDFDQTFKQGHFAFQQHDPGSVVSIRKIEVQELP